MSYGIIGFPVSLTLPDYFSYNYNDISLFVFSLLTDWYSKIIKGRSLLGKGSLKMSLYRSKYFCLCIFNKYSSSPFISCNHATILILVYLALFYFQLQHWIKHYICPCSKNLSYTLIFFTTYTFISCCIFWLVLLLNSFSLTVFTHLRKRVLYLGDSSPQII